MNKDEKQAAAKEIGEQLAASSAVFAVDYRGISVSQAAELRGNLSEADATFNVVKNRLAKRVTADAGAEALDEHLVGPTALTYVRGDAVLAAKAISQFTKQHSVLAYKGGIMEGAALDPDQFNAIARLPGLDVLHGQLVGLAATPLTGIVRSLNGLIQGLATQLGQISEQGLVGGDAAAEAPQAEPEPAPEEDAPAGDPASGESEDAPSNEAKDAASGESEEAPAGEAEEAADADDGPGEATDDANDEGPVAEADDSAEAGSGDEPTEPKED